MPRHFVDYPAPSAPRHSAEHVQCYAECRHAQRRGALERDVFLTFDSVVKKVFKKVFFFKKVRFCFDQGILKGEVSLYH